MTYIDNFVDYLQYERNYSVKTLHAYRKDIEQFYQDICISSEKECSLNELNVYTVRSWMVSLMDRGYATTSVNRKLSSLSVYSRFLLKTDRIDADNLSLVSGPKNKQKLPSFIRSKDLEELLDGEFFGDDFEGCRDRLIIDVFYTTGIRLSELIGLDDEDVDFSKMQIKVLGKGNKERIIPFGDKLLTGIKRYLKSRNETVSTKTDKSFFVRKSGERVYKSLVYNIVKHNLSAISTLIKCSPHVLRHSFATNMLNNGADLQVIKEVLGHTSLSATEVYTHTTFKELKKVYNQAHPRA